MWETFLITGNPEAMKEKRCILNLAKYTMTKSKSNGSLEKKKEKKYIANKNLIFLLNAPINFKRQTLELGQ